MSKRSWRPGTAVPDLDDLRQVYRKLVQLEVRMSEMQAQLHMVLCRVQQDRKDLDQISHNMQAMVHLFHDMPMKSELEALLKEMLDRAES